MSNATPRWEAGPLTVAALGLAANLFAQKPRKGSDTPYLSHLLAVSALVMEYGGSEVQAAAGLLHDVIEDTEINGPELERLLAERGAPLTAVSEVVAIVQATTDGRPDQPRDAISWYERKRSYIATLREKSNTDPALLVSLADKVHNAEATLREVRAGTSATELYQATHFNAKAPAQKWYYEQLVAALGDRLADNARVLPLVLRLEEAVSGIFVGVTTAQPE